MAFSVVVLGGGSAGLIAALTIKRHVPGVTVRLIRSEKIGIIGVGEGTTAYFPSHFFDFLGLHPRKFYSVAKPTWKLGIRFIWGPREDFYYSFQPEYGLSYAELSREPGYYYGRDSRWAGMCSACMAHNTAFPKLNGHNLPDLRLAHAFHVENHNLVVWLEGAARAMGVELLEGTMLSVEQSDKSIEALVMEDGSRYEADLFVDASGFRSELLGQVLEEPFVDYSDYLFCDRAWIGGWSRKPDEPIRPYTTAETMDSGWCWQIEHEDWVNRGYVFSSGFISDDQALEEMMRKNPRIENEPRLVKFRSGRARRGWVNNVVAVGNASGFVEPLEATALHIICLQSNRIAQILSDTVCTPTQTTAAFFNQVNETAWDDTRDFLAVHYAYNTRLDTAFWQHCLNKTQIGGAEPLVEFYKENGPMVIGNDYLIRNTNSFGLEGYYAMLLGQEVPFKRSAENSAAETERWNNHLSKLAERAKSGISIKKALAIVRKSGWNWDGVYTPQPGR